MIKSKFYVTTAIPYVNASPHIGFALEVIQADVIARYHRLLGEDVWFLTGTDENALKNVQAAEKEGIPVQKLVAKYAAQYRRLKKILNLSNDDFIRTTEERHLRGAQAFWLACQPDDIYKKPYQGLYCVGCETFVTEKDLVDGKCPEHLKEPEPVEETNYFFRLSRYQKQLAAIIQSDQLRIIPETRKNEVLSFIQAGLEDLSISRSVERAKGWGIPVPGDPTQIQYVWFDALLNYVTALGFAGQDAKFAKYWPADVHVIGKGISRFHAIYWPAFLLSANLPIPKTIFIHGYLTVAGAKISKSLGNVIDPVDLVNKYGTDPLRYYFLAKIPASGDGDFNRSHFEEVYQAELANGLGNLIQRVTSLCDRSKLSFPVEPTPSLPILWPELKETLANYRFHDSLALLWKKLQKLDQLIDQQRPWELIDQESSRLSQILTKLVTEIRQIAVGLEPFLPDTAHKIQDQFNRAKIAPGNVLFPRLE